MPGSYFKSRSAAKRVVERLFFTGRAQVLWQPYA